MLNKILACIFAGCSFAAFAGDGNSTSNAQMDFSCKESVKPSQIPTVKRSLNEFGTTMRKAGDKQIAWQRPRGHFFYTPYDLNSSDNTDDTWYILCPIVLRPWTDYTYYNLSNVFGTPTWTGQEVAVVDGDLQYVDFSSNDQDLTRRYLWRENNFAPLLTYSNQGSFGYLYNGGKPLLANDGKTQFQIYYVANSSLNQSTDFRFPCSSTWYNPWTLEKDGRSLVSYYGLDDYEGTVDDEGFGGGHWFGTNASGQNAAAVRFEKPDEPYLLKSVHYFYYAKNVKNPITLKAYVFKTEDPSVEQVIETQNGERTVHYAGLGELIATSEATVPVISNEGNDNEYSRGMLEFLFKKVNPVNGTVSIYDLEISDDITVVVTGFEQKVGDNTEEYAIWSPISQCNVDYGYGDLAYVGSFDLNEEGTLEYSLMTCADRLGGNWAPGILIDVEYPWLRNLNLEGNEIRFANTGNTETNSQTGEITKMGLQYPMYLYATATTEDWEILFDGEEECDWLQYTDVVDFTDENEDGEEVYAGESAVVFVADENPNDETRVSHVTVSIPGATYEVTMLQGSKASGVEAVVNDVKTVYYDLMGRKVTNPEKGIYIQKNGKESKKVIF